MVVKRHASPKSTRSTVRAVPLRLPGPAAVPASETATALCERVEGARSRRSDAHSESAADDIHVRRMGHRLGYLVDRSHDLPEEDQDASLLPVGNARVEREEKIRTQLARCARSTSYLAIQASGLISAPVLKTVDPL